MDTGAKINWEDEGTHLFLNPRMPQAEAVDLQKLSELYSLKAHIWIASSGSSKQANQSLKLIALSKFAFLSSAAAVNEHLQSDRRDIWLQNLPRFHVGGLSIETRAFLSGAKVVSQLQWSAENFFETVNTEKVTLSALVPTQVFDLVQTGKKAPASLRAIVVGGAALAQDLYEKAIDLGWPLLPSYGMTECCSQIATADLNSWSFKNRSLKLLSHVQARTTSDGILEVKSSALLTGLAQINDGQPTWQDPKVQGWYRSQDLADVQGNVLTPLGRGSDFVKVLGEGVDLQRLRWLLEKVAQEEIPGEWQNVNLTAKPDHRRGHKLVLQTLRGTDVQKVFEVLNSQVAPFERLQEIEIVTELPWKKKNPQAW